MKDIVFLLGANDPEMSRIAALLKSRGVAYLYARRYGKFVAPHNAYRANGTRRYVLPKQRVVFVECKDEKINPFSVIDHHQPGDGGYSMPPADYPLGSSLGQVWLMLVLEGVIQGDGDDAEGADANMVGWQFRNMSWELFDKLGRKVAVPFDHILAMAADHCLFFAYSNERPGVEAEELLEWRVKVRALYQRRSEDDVRKDILDCLEYLDFSDCRDYTFIAGEKILNIVNMPELTDAAAIKRVGYCLQMMDSTSMRIKLKFRAYTKDAVNSWMAEMRAGGLECVYGSPARGYAGAVHRLK